MAGGVAIRKSKSHANTELRAMVAAASVRSRSLKRPSRWDTRKDGSAQAQWHRMVLVRDGDGHQSRNDSDDESNRQNEPTHLDRAIRQT